MPLRFNKTWLPVYRTAVINLLLLFGLDLLVRHGLLPAAWSLQGAGLALTAGFALWSAYFIWQVARPFRASLHMVLREHISRIDYLFLLGLAVVTISYFALLYFFVPRLDPGGLNFEVDRGGAADLLYVSTATFIASGFDVMTAISWWPRLAMLTETLMGLGYLAGILALLTNRLASEPVEQGKAAAGPDLTEGTAWAGGSAAGAAVGSVAGPVGTAVGALVGGILADESVDAQQEGEATAAPPPAGAPAPQTGPHPHP